MNRLLTLFIVGMIIVGASMVILYVGKGTNHSQTETSTTPTEQFVLQHLLRQNGAIRTNFKDKDEGQIALSESIGLWMEYLAEKEDAKLFKEAFHTIQDHFLSKDKLIVWKIDNGERAHTNALIDDLRIIEALFREGERTNHKKYISTAKAMSKGILKYNRQGDDFVDFYDHEYKYANDELTLSYLIPGAFHYMEKYQLLSTESLKTIRTFMAEIPLNNDFYPKYYQVNEQIFHYDDIVNLIDQLYIAIHIERFGLTTDELYEWLKAEFYKDHLLYGRYDGKTKERSVDYEAAAVYALAIIYSLEKKDHTFAKDLYEQMITMKVTDSDSIYFGGYVDVPNVSTHSFDNLLPLLAERKLMNEQIIN